MTDGVTICVCTSGRPEMLRRCLASIDAGTQRPMATIVSDDSGDTSVSAEIRTVCDSFAGVRYTRGPRRGLCANRNHVIREAISSHVSLLDDDAVVDARFIELALAAIEEQPETILTGDVLESGEILTPPTNPTRWGHFGQVVREGEALRNLHLNCNVIPRKAFSDAAFDERLAYGYEDTDLCDRLVSRGWKIIHHPELVNTHLPAERGSRNWMAERERFAVLLRRRARQGGPAAVPVWAALAGVHAVAAFGKRGQWGWIASLPGWLARAIWITVRGPSPERLVAHAEGPR